MYAREVDARTLTFAVSGLLWEHSLVMIDEQTESLWSHLLGECMRGELQGAQLETIPSTITDWESWRTRYPHTSVVLMSRTADEYRRGVHLGDLPLPTMPVEDALLIGLADAEQARCWGFVELRQRGAINDRFGKQAVVVALDAVSGTAVIFNRRLDERELTFELHDGNLLDQQTGSQWDLVTGQAVRGAMQGQQLEQLPGTVSLTPAWFTFHPDSTRWSPK